METFYNHWDSGHHGEWIPCVKHAKDLFSKESQNGDQFEATIIQGPTDDILITIDEFSQEDEFDGGPIYKDLEFMIEYAKDRMSSSFQHAKNPYDLLHFWEHNGGNSEDDGYWTFMGPPFYDS